MVVVVQRLNTQQINQKAVGSNPATFLSNFPSLNVEFLNQILKWWHFYFLSDSKKIWIASFWGKTDFKSTEWAEKWFLSLFAFEAKELQSRHDKFPKDPKMASLRQLFAGNQEIANLINNRTSF